MNPSAVDWKPLEELAKNALKGDRKAYDMLLRSLVRVLTPRFQMSLSPQAAEEALQETLIAIHRSLHTLDPARGMAGWVYAIARHKALDQMRRFYRSEERSTVLDEEAVIEENVVEASISSDLKRLMNQLPARDAQILGLLKIEQWSVQEIAQKFGIGESNVKTIAHRALLKLRTSLTEEAFYAPKN